MPLLPPTCARSCSRFLLGCFALLSLAALSGCHRNSFPQYPANFREFAYVANGSAGTVTVLDLVYLRRDRVLTTGRNPVALAVNHPRNEIYAINSGSDSVSVIDPTTNTIAFTLGVRRNPTSIAVAPDGLRAYVTNAGSNSVSVLDLAARRQIAIIAAGEQPTVARVAPDNRSLVVTNRKAGSVSVYSINSGDDSDDSNAPPLTLREAFPGCPGASDAVILPDSSKAFVACTAAHQIMAIWLAAAPDSWRGKQDASLQHDQMLTLLDVGDAPTHIVLKPDGGEVFSLNRDSDSISEISTWTNEVLGTYIIGAKPARGVISRDDSTLWVTNFGADSASLYSIDDGRIEGGVRTGSRPEAIAFSHDEELLLIADTGSSDVAAIRTQSKDGPSLLTLLPGGADPTDLVVDSFTLKPRFHP